MVRLDTPWEYLKKLPPGNLARIFLGAKKARWSMLGVVTNRAGQSFLQIGGAHILVPSECREHFLETIDAAQNRIT